MTEDVFGRSRVLVVEVQGHFCAVPLVRVIEIMRPLPVEAIAGAPPFVLGVSIIRGVPIPVVELGILLGVRNGRTLASSTARCVTLRLGERQAALSVDAVCGTQELDTLTTRELPPLLQGASSNFIESFAMLDAQMLVVLRSGWQLPDAVWESLAALRLPQALRNEIASGEVSERA